MKLAAFGETGKAAQVGRLDAMWAFVKRCQTKQAEPLLQILEKCLENPDEVLLKKVKRQSDGQKWKQVHEAFKKQHSIKDADEHPLLVGLRQQASRLPACLT